MIQRLALPPVSHCLALPLRPIALIQLLRRLTTGIAALELPASAEKEITPLINAGGSRMTIAAVQLEGSATAKQKSDLVWHAYRLLATDTDTSSVCSLRVGVYYTRPITRSHRTSYRAELQFLPYITPVYQISAV